MYSLVDSESRAAAMDIMTQFKRFSRAPRTSRLFRLRAYRFTQCSQRKFVETIDLQFTLKNYDPQRDKRFSGTLLLPHIPRPKMKVCIFGDQLHIDQAKVLGVPSMDQGL